MCRRGLAQLAESERMPVGVEDWNDVYHPLDRTDALLAGPCAARQRRVGA
jgi:hypothetical protein